MSAPRRITIELTAADQAALAEAVRHMAPAQLDDAERWLLGRCIKHGLQCINRRGVVYCGEAVSMEWRLLTPEEFALHKSYR